MDYLLYSFIYLILIQYRLLPAYVTNYLTKLYLNWYVALNIQKQNVLENKMWSNE